MPGVVAAPNRPGIAPLILGSLISAYGANLTNKDTGKANIAIADTTAKNLAIDDQVGWFNSAQTEGNKLLNLKAAYAKAQDDATRQKLAADASIIRDGFMSSKAFSRMNQQQRDQWINTFGPEAQYMSADGTMSGVPVYGGQQYGLYNNLINNLEAEKKQNSLNMAEAKSPTGGLLTNLLPAIGTALTHRAIGAVYPRYQ